MIVKDDGFSTGNISYVDSILKFGHVLSNEDVSKARNMCGSSFQGSIEQIFLVIKEISIVSRIPIPSNTSSGTNPQTPRGHGTGRGYRGSRGSRGTNRGNRGNSRRSSGFSIFSQTQNLVQPNLVSPSLTNGQNQLQFLSQPHHQFFVTNPQSQHQPSYAQAVQSIPTTIFQ